VHGGCEGDAADADGKHDDHPGHGTGSLCGVRSATPSLPVRHACVGGLQGHVWGGQGRSLKDGCSQLPDSGAPGLSEPQCEALLGARRRQEGGTVAECGWWSIEPDVGRVAHGVAARVDRIKGLGNGQVPLQAATAWVLLGGPVG
jgi:hypothetical protein